MERFECVGKRRTAGKVIDPLVEIIVFVLDLLGVALRGVELLKLYCLAKPVYVLRRCA